MKTCGYSKTKGFSLVEMAIVLVIIGLLLGGLLMPLSTQMEQRRISETQKALDEINQALMGFAISNGFLPCPADPTLPSGAIGAGLARARTAAACTGGNNGALPWATLGVGETDAWGNRYTYRVTTTFADATDGTGCSGAPRAGVSFELCSVGDAVISATSGGATLATTIPAVIVSHGRNGAGAYNTTGAQQPVSTDADEAENSDADIDFVNKTATATYDDLVTWISPNTLYNRMVAAGRLP